eukprot:jgi/Mesen1/2677/ME000167S01827
MGSIDDVVKCTTSEDELVDTLGSYSDGSLVDGGAIGNHSDLLSSAWSHSSSAFHNFHMDSSLIQQSEEKEDTHAPLVARLTVHLTDTYKACNAHFAYSEALIPRRVVALTKPSEGLSNDGLDNANSDLILTVDGVLINSEARCGYVVKEMLGQGTFGQVAKCIRDDTGDMCAVKVIKNQPAYFHQAQVEISILRLLNEQYDVDDKHHIVRLVDHFVFQRHLCIVFELLTYNLFELIKQNQFQGLPMHLVRLFTKQLLDSLGVLQEANVIHCDLKPENILLKGLDGDIKLIDFGSACKEDRTVYSYIQSRFYRSPEVLLGHAYSTAIDMWSLGCVAAELFLGLPLFPGASEYDLLQRMVETLGAQPPDHMLHSSKQTSRFFKRSPAPPSRKADTGAHAAHASAYTLLTMAEFEEKEKARPATGKRYFRFSKLDEIVLNYTLRSNISDEDADRERKARVAFIDFLKGLVEIDPAKRWTPHQAVQHPFITEEAFVGPWQPPPEPAALSPKQQQQAQDMAVPPRTGSDHPSSWGGSAPHYQVTNSLPSQLQHHHQQQHQQQQQAAALNNPHLSAMAHLSPLGMPGSYGTSYGTSYGSLYDPLLLNSYGSCADG